MKNYTSSSHSNGSSKEQKKYKILLICSAATCRSPMAAVILQSALGDKYECFAGDLFSSEKSIQKTSVNENAVYALEKNGYHFEDKRVVIKKEIVDADLVFVLGDELLEDAKREFPEYAKKILRYTPPGVEKVPDPYDYDNFSEDDKIKFKGSPNGKCLPAYKKCVQIMRDEYTPRVCTITKTYLNDKDVDIITEEKAFLKKNLFVLEPSPSIDEIKNISALFEIKTKGRSYSL